MRLTLLLAALFFMTAQTTFASTDPVLPTMNIEEMRGSIHGVYETQGSGGYAHYYVYVMGARSVVMVALNFDQSFACVYQGEISGRTEINGSWLSLPYGQFKGEGEASMKIVNNGRTIQITDGDLPHTTLKKIDARRVRKWPAQSGGFFSGGSTRDITGTYHADDAHRIFLRQKGNQVVFFSESMRTKANKDRPGLATLFMGRANRDGKSFSGTWFSLPMGVASGMSFDAEFQIIGPKYFRFDSGYFPGMAYRSWK